MTLTLRHLHAYIGLAALARSWPVLRTAAGQTTLAASDGLRSPLYGRISSGTPGDGGMLAAVEQPADEATRWQQLLQRVADHAVHAHWLARSAAPATPRRGLLGTIASALPYITSRATLDDITHTLAAADRAARHATQLDPDTVALTGLPCPVCGTRLLTAHTAARSRHAWVVTCGAGCRCGGPTCPCGDTGTGPSLGAVHAWRWTVIAARHTAPECAAA